MGTRNLTIVLKDGEHKVAQYCQWDGYPEGQGRTAFNLLKGAGTVVEQSLSKCQWITDELVEERWREAHEACDVEFHGMEHGVTFDVSTPSQLTSEPLLSVVENSLFFEQTA